MIHIKDKMLFEKNIKFLVVHCSDTADDKDLGASDIHKMHLNFGWDGIGYHKIIRRNGEVENGRPEYWVGAHVYGKNNESLGICLIGRNKFKETQFKSLFKELKSWKAKYPKSKIIGHCDVINTKKTCPNFNLNLWCQQVGLK
tara:strand:+ start:43 stop:471 length:429 start_codon:yes stop_codon:yes gene_type:complete